MDRLWYRDFFDEVVNDFWQQVVPAEHTQAEVDLAWRELRLQAGMNVLDVACGNGRHAIELARRGCRVTGIDISADNLVRAQRAADEAGAEIEFRLADIAEAVSLPACDAAITLGNSFGYLDHAATARFVSLMSDALPEGGRWLIDSGAVAESILPHLRPELEYSTPALTVRLRNRYLPLESCLETTFDFVTAGGIETRRNWHFVFTLSEVRRMFEAAGMEVIVCYGNTSREVYELGSPYLYLVAEKRSSC